MCLTWSCILLLVLVADGSMTMTSLVNHIMPSYNCLASWLTYLVFDILHYLHAGRHIQLHLVCTAWYVAFLGALEQLEIFLLMHLKVRSPSLKSITHWTSTMQVRAQQHTTCSPAIPFQTQDFL